MKQQYAFNSWGERVDATDWQTVLASTTFLPVSQQFTTHSYTGQDALDAVGLINYGGRIYDERFSRFIQADPIVQDGENLQAYNRYAYVLNNPLTLTDPSGFCSKWNPICAARHLGDAISKGPRAVISQVDPGLSWIMSQSVDKWVKNSATVREIGMVAMTAVDVYFCGGSGACVAGYSAYVTEMMGGSLTDQLKAGAIAGASAYAFHSVGDYFNLTPVQAFSTMPLNEAAVYSAESIVTHGMVGGVMSVLSGGNFGSGFVGAGLSTGLSLTSLAPGSGFGMEATRIALAAAAGGTASELTGGKFANGAISAAFSQAFNEEMDHSDKSGGIFGKVRDYLWGVTKEYVLGDGNLVSGTEEQIIEGGQAFYGMDRAKAQYDFNVYNTSGGTEHSSYKEFQSWNWKGNDFDEEYKRFNEFRLKGPGASQ